MSREELVLRRNFIGSVTGADVTPWQPVIQNGRVCPTCAITCESNDDINGLLITGHVYDLRYFYPLIDRKKPEFVILNTCALFSELREVILTWLMRSVPNVSLYYAHQQRTLTFRMRVISDFRPPSLSVSYSGTERKDYVKLLRLRLTT